MLVTGLAPYLPAHRPLAAARWWIATGELGDPLRLSLSEQAQRPGLSEPSGRLAIAAPCSLPDEFLAFLEKPPGAFTTNRLLAKAREFATRRHKGHKHPRRNEHEQLSALDRRRLPLYCAALPLLKHEPIEVEAAVLLRELDLPCTGLSGEVPAAVGHRVRILDALRDGASGARVEVEHRELAIASHHALFAILAAVAAARA